MQEDWQENLVSSNKILMQISEDIKFHDEIRAVCRAFTVLTWFLLSNSFAPSKWQPCFGASVV